MASGKKPPHSDPLHRARRALFVAWYDEHWRKKKRTQQELAERVKLTKGRISQYLDPSQPFGEDAARDLAKRIDSAISRLPENAFIASPAAAETPAQRQVKRLRQLSDKFGGLDAIADRSGVQIDRLRKSLTRSSTQELGGGSDVELPLSEADTTAIERAFSLGTGWFISEGEQVEVSPNEMKLLGYFRDLEPSMQMIVVDYVRRSVEEQEAFMSRMRKTDVGRPTPEIRVHPRKAFSSTREHHEKAKK